MAKAEFNISSVLIDGCNGIGDVVLNMPLYAALRVLFPFESIILLGHPWAENLLRYTGLIDFHLTVRIPWAHGEGKYLSPTLIREFLVPWRQLCI